jgi:nicotinamidase-related amidase
MGRGGPGSDALIVIDAISDFQHEDGAVLARSFAAVAPQLARAIAAAHAGGTPVIYVNDARGHWDGDRRALLERALSGRAPDAVAAVAPEASDRVLYKPRYSAFDSTALVLVLEELQIDRVVLAGTTTEMCVAQTAIQAREHDLAVSVLRDACADLDADDAAIALEYLERVTGSYVVRTEDWIAEHAARRGAGG